MTPESWQNLLSLALGFAMAGLFTSAYQLATSKVPSFGMLSTGPSPQAFAAVPLLMITAPFLIMRNTLLGQRQELRDVGVLEVRRRDHDGFWRDGREGFPPHLDPKKPVSQLLLDDLEDFCRLQMAVSGLRKE